MYPHLLDCDFNSASIEIGLLGKYKNLHWQFQKEWRYILSIMPLNILSSPEICYFDFKKLFQDLCLGGGKQPFPYFDMVISDDAFNEMEIQLSPCISPGNKIIFENLVEKYNCSATIKESSLLGLI